MKCVCMTHPCIPRSLPRMPPSQFVGHCLTCEFQKCVFYHKILWFNRILNDIFYGFTYYNNHWSQGAKDFWANWQYWRYFWVDFVFKVYICLLLESKMATFIGVHFSSVQHVRSFSWFIYMYLYIVLTHISFQCSGTPTSHHNRHSLFMGVIAVPLLCQALNMVQYLGYTLDTHLIL